MRHRTLLSKSSLPLLLSLKRKDQKKRRFLFPFFFSPILPSLLTFSGKPRDAFVDQPPFFFRPRKSAALLILIFFCFFFSTYSHFMAFFIISLLFHYLSCNNDRNKVMLGAVYCEGGETL